MNKLGYRPALDGLRAVAVGVVLGAHSGFPLLGGGDLGVDIFFVLSGFLITKLILEEQEKFGRLDKPRFWLRRLVRLSPPLIVMLSVVTVGRLALREPLGVVLREFLFAGTYTTNLKTAFFGGYDGGEALYFGHTWSLSVEEQFYLVWPFILVWAVSSKRKEFLIRLGLVFPLIGLVGRLLVTLLDHPDLMQLPIFHFEGFAVGSALAILYHRNSSLLFSQSKWRTVGSVCALVLAVEVVVGKQWREVVWAPQIALDTYLSAGLLMTVVLGGSKIHSVLSHRVVTYVGKMSYSIYLWHLPVFVFFNARRFPDMPAPVLASIELLATGLVSVLSYRLIEQRLEFVRSRLRPQLVV